MLVPALDKDGNIFLYDIFVDGKWIGSRRTLKQAIAALGSAEWPSSVIATDYHIEQGSPAKIYFRERF